MSMQVGGRTPHEVFDLLSPTFCCSLCMCVCVCVCVCVKQRRSGIQSQPSRAVCRPIGALSDCSRRLRLPPFISFPPVPFDRPSPSKRLPQRRYPFLSACMSACIEFCLRLLNQFCQEKRSEAEDEERRTEEQEEGKREERKEGLFERKRKEERKCQQQTNKQGTQLTNDHKERTFVSFFACSDSSLPPSCLCLFLFSLPLTYPDRYHRKEGRETGKGRRGREVE
mmetsp:Transcript_19010/g.38425  ORF Transcript_19010/g.38425 Transcript_19010/m.38425 type:complete len:225 (+) Transcript_19010:1530-2204(+)